LEVEFAKAVKTKMPLKAVERLLLAYGEFAIEEPHAFELCAR
jgi:hypothetical protein